MDPEELELALQNELGADYQTIEDAEGEDRSFDATRYTGPDLSVIDSDETHAEWITSPQKMAQYLSDWLNYQQQLARLPAAKVWRHSDPPRPGGYSASHHNHMLIRMITRFEHLPFEATYTSVIIAALTAAAQMDWGTLQGMEPQIDRAVYELIHSTNAES